MQALGDAEPANTAYSTALALYQQLPDGWVSWGSHCDQMYQASRNTAWLDYAVTCYLQVSLINSRFWGFPRPFTLHPEVSRPSIDPALTAPYEQDKIFCVSGPYYEACAA